MNLKNGKVFTSKFVGTGPSSYEKRIYLAAVSQILRITGVGERRSSNLCTNYLIAFLALLRQGKSSHFPLYEYTLF